MGFLGGTVMKKTCLSMQETQEMQVQSLGWEDLLGEEMALPTPIFLPRESHGQRSLTGHSPRGRKESDMTEHACMHLYIMSFAHFFCQVTSLYFLNFKSSLCIMDIIRLSVI